MVKDKKTSATPEKEDPKKQEQDEHDAQVEQLRHVFDYFDTDRDHIVDSSTAKRILEARRRGLGRLVGRRPRLRRRGRALARRAHDDNLGLRGVRLLEVLQRQVELERLLGVLPVPNATAGLGGPDQT